MARRDPSPGPSRGWWRGRALTVLRRGGGAVAALLLVAGIAAVDATGPPGPPPAPGATPLRVVALGDSVPTANACGCVSYVTLLADQLGVLTRRPPVVHNDAMDGWQTADVVDDLDSPATRSHLRDADLVVVEIGANDFDFSQVADPACYPAETSTCWAGALAGLRTGLTQIVQTVQSIDRTPHAQVAVIGYWNVTVDGDVGHAQGPAFVAGSDALTRTVNSTIEQVAARTGAVYVDAYTGFKGVYGQRDPTVDLVSDGDHPNQAGHQLLMQAVLSALVRAGDVDAWDAS